MTFQHVSCRVKSRFVWQVQHFGDLRCPMLRGRCSTFGVSCSVFFANRTVSAARSGDKVQIPWHAWHFVTCDENRGSILRSIRKTRRKTSMLKLQNVKCKEVSHERLLLRLQHVSSRVAGFLVPSQCLWEKLQNLSLLNVSKQVVMSFCMAGVALPDIFTCLQTRRKSFCVAGAILLRRFQKMICSFRGRRSTLETSTSELSGLRQVVTLNAPQSTLHTLHSTLHTLHSTLYTPHFTLDT